MANHHWVDRKSLYHHRARSLYPVLQSPCFQGSRAVIAEMGEEDHEQLSSICREALTPFNDAWVCSE